MVRSIVDARAYFPHIQLRPPLSSSGIPYIIDAPIPASADTGHDMGKGGNSGGGGDGDVGTYKGNSCGPVIRDVGGSGVLTTTVLTYSGRSQCRDELGWCLLGPPMPCPSSFESGNYRTLKSYLAGNQDGFYGIHVCTLHRHHISRIFTGSSSVLGEICWCCMGCLSFVLMIGNLWCYLGLSPKNSERIPQDGSLPLSLCLGCDIVMEPGLTESTLVPHWP